MYKKTLLSFSAPLYSLNSTVSSFNSYSSYPVWCHSLFNFASVEKKDPYLTIRAAIATKAITEFRQIFDHFPKTTIAKELGKNNTSITNLKDDVGKLNIADIYNISIIMGVDIKDLIRIILTQFYNDKGEPDKYQ